MKHPTLLVMALPLLAAAQNYTAQKMSDQDATSFA